MIKKSCYIIGIAILAVSCKKINSSQVNQQNIHAVYTLSYDGVAMETTASASFRLGSEVGAELEILDPAFCTFNTDTLFYEWSTSDHEMYYDSFISSGTFHYVDQDQKSYTNTTGVIDTIIFNGIDSLSKSSDYEYIWVGGPVAENETVTITIVNSSDVEETFTTITEGDTSVMMLASELDNFSTGWTELTIKRIHNKTSLDQGTNKGGRIVAEYVTYKDLYIKP